MGLYRVRDISTFLIKNRLREWGITLAVIALISLFTYPFMAIILGIIFVYGGEIFIGFLLMLYFGITTMVDDGNLALQRGVARSTFAKSYTFASLVCVMVSTIVVLVFRTLPNLFNGPVVVPTLLGVKLEDINFLQSFIMHFICILTFSGITNNIAISVYGTQGGKIGAVPFYIYLFITPLIPVLVRNKWEVPEYLNIFHLMGIPTQFIILIGLVLSIGLYYISYKQILKLEI